MQKILLIILLAGHLLPVHAQQPPNTCVTAYYAGPAARLDSFATEQLTHLIFSFGHLQGNRLHIASGADTACIQKMVSFKTKNQQLKVILSLGGWGGCYSCSSIFNSADDRKEFALSVKELSEYFKTDGIDIDWEYPAIAGHPGHPYASADRKSFTLLLKQLRKTLGKKQEISFAAGGFNSFIDSSVQWKKAMHFADKVYLMSYDLVHGFSTASGHHTPLYSTPQQEASAENAISRILAKKVPAKKIVMGAAFYARMFLVDDTLQRGLYRPGRFYRGISYAHLYDSISIQKGFVPYWDDSAQAPYAFNAERKILVTYDDSISVSRKTQYALQHKLGGIMFWQLADDAYSNGLLQVITGTRKKGFPAQK
ncbi:MAG: glycosyl hydrolase family 18 protein [Ferruginibacter sp.]